VQRKINAQLGIGECGNEDGDVFLRAGLEDAATRGVTLQIFPDAAVNLPTAGGVIGVPVMEDVLHHLLDGVEIHLRLERIVDAVVTSREKLAVVHFGVVAEMRAACGFDEAMGHQRPGRNNRFYNSRLDKIAEKEAHFADGHRAGEGHDDKAVLVSRHGFEHIRGVADLPAGECRPSHSADEIVDGVDARQIKRKNRNQAIFDRVMQDAARRALFLCHSVPSQVM